MRYDERGDTMGLLRSLFNSTRTEFVPNFELPEYDNWLNFLNSGGTTKEWESLKAKNNWKFKKSETKIFLQYQNEVKSISDKYYSLMDNIQRDWSVLYNLKDYTGKIAHKIEEECFEDIALYNKMREIDMKYGESSPTNIPAFKRLAMLYEKQEKFEEAIDICKQACSFGMDERSRMIRMIKKAGRNPTREDLKIIND